MKMAIKINRIKIDNIPCIYVTIRIIPSLPTPNLLRVLLIHMYFTFNPYTKLNPKHIIDNIISILSVTSITMIIMMLIIPITQDSRLHILILLYVLLSLFNRKLEIGTEFKLTSNKHNNDMASPNAEIILYRVIGFSVSIFIFTCYYKLFF
jgi:hypothetical protein